uniref:Uncharacterized protein n=1 Tax=Panagrolaimus sp. JU765 TaxID=591449 RepID=A0AC34QGV3_9BILA
MLQHAKNLNTYKTINTMSINEARCAVLLLLEPLAMVLTVLEACSIHYQDYNAVKQTLIDGNVIDANMSITSLGEFRTVCTSEKCTKKDENDCVVYEACHKQCKLQGIGIKMPKDEKLKDCAAFEEIYENGEQKFVCLECGCPFEYHIRIAFTTNKTQGERKNIFLQKLVDQIQQKKKTEENVAKEIIKQLEKEKEIIEKSAFMFGRFLKENAILTSNKAFEQRLEMEIKKAEQESNFILASKLQTSLINFKKNEEYLEKYSTGGKIKEFIKGITSAEINKQRTKLFEMELYGSKIKEIYETQKLLTKNSISDDDIVNFVAKVEFV